MSDHQLDTAKKHFETIKSVDKEGQETWSARDLMVKLGYDKWENFEKVIQRAQESCSNSGFIVSDHFPEVRKMITIATGTAKETSRYILDYALSRYACYLIAQNGDPSKDQIAWAQSYFALQARRQEVMIENSQALERLSAREKLSKTEKKFAGVLHSRGISGKGIGLIRARGDKALAPAELAHIFHR